MWLKLTGVEPTYGNGPPKLLGPAYYNFSEVKVFRVTRHGNCTVLSYSAKSTEHDRFVRESPEEIYAKLRIGARA